MIRPVLKICAISLSVLAALPGLAEQKGKVLGKLGQTIKAANIYSSPSTKGRVYYRAKEYEYIIINSSKHLSWLRVKLQNGKDGYITQESVARLPYDVTQALPVASKSRSTTTTNFRSAPTGSRAEVANYALNYIGTPYVWGGNNLNKGIDCSGFVQQLYGGIGLNLPRTASEQALVGQAINRLEDLQPGDRLYFWENKRAKIGHTGIYLGNGYFVHSSRTHNGVATDDLRNTKWRKILVAARR